MYKRYSQILAAVFTRLASTAMPPISTATSTRMATCTAAITVRTSSASSTRMAMWKASRSGRREYLEV